MSATADLPDPPPPVQIDRITALPDLSQLLDASLAENHRLIERTIREFNSGDNRFDRPGEALFVGRDHDNRVVAICGLNIDPYLNDPSIGRVRHLYVLPESRRRGIARALLERVINAAQGRFRILRVRTHNPAADALYRSAGFVATSEDQTETHRRSL